MKLESPVSTDRMRFILGGERPCGCGARASCKKCKGSGNIATPWARSRMSALKSAMGLSGNNCFPSQIIAWLQSHQNFSERDVYGRSTTWRVTTASGTHKIRAPKVHLEGGVVRVGRIEIEFSADVVDLKAEGKVPKQPAE